MKRINVFISIVLVVLLAACTNEPGPITFEDEELTIARSLESKEAYSELFKALKRTQYFNILALQGDFTLLAAENSEMQAYYQSIGKATLDDLSEAEVNNLVETHIFYKTIKSVSFKAGRMTPPVNGATLVMSFTEEGIKSAQINDVGFSEFDIPRTNGVIHKVNQVITPPSKTIGEKIKETADYSIFYEALIETGAIEILNDPSEANIGRFTVFVESNAAFASGGIKSYEDLKNKYASLDDVADPEDKLNQFMRYHIVDGDFTILEFQSGVYNTLLNYPLGVEIEETIKINKHIEEGIESYATVNLDFIDKSFRNGFIQELASEIPVIEINPKGALFVGSSLALNTEELDPSKVIYANDAEGPWISSDAEVLQYLCTEVGDYLEFYSPYLFNVDYQVYYEAASYNPGRTILGVYINDQPVGEPFVNDYEKMDPEAGQYGLYVGKVKIESTGFQRVKIKVEGEYFYPDDNFIRLKKIYFVPDI